MVYTLHREGRQLVTQNINSKADITCEEKSYDKRDLSGTLIYRYHYKEPSPDLIDFLFFSNRV